MLGSPSRFVESLDHPVRDIALRFQDPAETLEDAMDEDTKASRPGCD